MNVAILEELLAFAAAAEPALYEAVKRLIEAFKQQHPTLGDPPPVDDEATADHAGDDALTAKFGPPTKPAGDESKGAA